MKSDDRTFRRVTAVTAESFTATEGPRQQRSTEDVCAAEFAYVPLWKRVVDISCSLIAIPSLLPLMLLIAIFVKISSKGPVLFRQERVGLCGKPFIMFKFRTMAAGTDTAVHEAHIARLIETNVPMTKLDAHGDVRLIPLGWLLRAAGLDELPQLFNVLRGEMSFVGPRPCLPSEYSRYLPWQKERLHTLPGLTGLWQVSGKNRTNFNEMIELDIKYIHSRSLLLDLGIMLKTIPTVLDEVKEVTARHAPASPRHPS
jgi:exopolysaccharide production protein ExoY